MFLIDILRLIIALTGVGLFAITLSSLARRKMTESFCLTWGLVSVMLIIAGLVLRPYGIANIMSVTALVVIVVVGYCLLWGFYYITAKVSELTRKNQELAIQVSLINQENQMMMEKIEELTHLVNEKVDNA